MRDKKYWLDERKNVMRLIAAFAVLCGVALLVDLLIHRHAEFSWEGWFGFYGFFGFVACVVLVLVAKEMRRILMRKEDHYDD